jgi:hypothetical protein
MTHLFIPASLLALLGIAAGSMRYAPSSEHGLDVFQIAQVPIHRRMVIRVPRMSAAPPSLRVMKTRIEWKEHRGPKCVKVGNIVNAMLSREGAVDLMMDDGARLRARLNGECKPLDFYSGFYLRPGTGGRICKGRNAIRMRSGSRCEIKEFRSLRTKK